MSNPMPRMVVPVKTCEALKQLYPLALLLQAGLSQDVARHFFAVTEDIGKKALTRMARAVRNASPDGPTRSHNQSQYLLDHKSLADAIRYIDLVRAHHWLIGYIDYLGHTEFPGQPEDAHRYVQLNPIDDINAPFVLADLIESGKVLLSGSGHWLSTNDGALKINRRKTSEAEPDESTCMRVVFSNVQTLRSYNTLMELFRFGLRQSIAETMLPFAPGRFIRKLFEQCSIPGTATITGSVASSPKTMLSDGHFRISAVSVLRAFEPDHGDSSRPSSVFVMNPETLLRAYSRYQRLAIAAGIPPENRIDINRAWSILRAYWTQTHPLAVVRRECGHTQLTNISRTRRQPCPVCRFLEPRVESGPGEGLDDVGRQQQVA